ncbi:MAG: pyridoxal phosphate-dependent aminotransferase [Methanobacteriota archaeon]|nr:MAG: pyridoxal phosphate-dependent aminotransferase [Euryarchaeota archaeon]
MTSIDNFEFAHEHRRDVVWMSQNTNTIPMPRAIKDAILRSVEESEYNLYPFKRGLSGLPEAVKEDLGLEEQDVLITNGGIEGEYMATRALLRPGDEVISTDPSFLPIHDQIAMAGARAVEIDIYREDYRLHADWANEAATARSRILLLIDPNNPLGSGYTRSEVRALAEVAKDHGLWVIHDITYRDFNPGHVLASEFYPDKTLISYSFSKGPGLAGMRVGALLGMPDALTPVKKYDTNVLGTNVLAQRAALAALQCKGEWLPMVRDIVRKNQEIIRTAVKKVKGCSLPVFPSMANMFVIDTAQTRVDPDAVEEHLLHDHLVHVRAGGYLSKRFGSRFVRVSFTIPTALCAKFGDAFPKVMEALASAKP